jgi:cell division septation protein DedD
MSNPLKNLWLVLVLIAAGVVLFSLSIAQKPQSDSVTLTEVFDQTPKGAKTQAATTETGAKDPVPSPAIVTSPENGHEADFVVQVYSFQSGERAAAALENLKAAGHKAFMEVSDLGEKGTWYRVRIGGLKDEDEAKALLEQVRQNYNSGFIIKPKV